MAVTQSFILAMFPPGIEAKQDSADLSESFFKSIYGAILGDATGIALTLAKKYFQKYFIENMKT